MNVASACGYTESGYTLINQLCELKKDGADVEIALFPCNQFGLFSGQETGSDAEIAGFCSAKGVEGATLFTKADVNGDASRPTYKTLKDTGVLPPKISWNFQGINEQIYIYLYIYIYNVYNIFLYYVINLLL